MAIFVKGFGTVCFFSGSDPTNSGELLRDFAAHEDEHPARPSDFQKYVMVWQTRPHNALFIKDKVFSRDTTKR